jgi:hypothetical protein
VSAVLRGYSLMLLAALTISSCTQSEPAEVEGDLSGFQAAILEDDTVDFAEYERAILAAMSCVEGHGFETKGPFASQGGRSLGFDAVVADDEQAAYDHVLQTCEQEFLFPLVDVYNASVAPSEHELQQGDEIVMACVRDFGYDVPDSEAAYEAVMANLGSLGVCLDERDRFLYK